jgi:hypothetical protein
MKIPDKLYNLYLRGSENLYPENIFKFDDPVQLKDEINSNNETQLFFKGTFDGKTLSVLGKFILHVIDNGSAVSEKLFKIYIELAQNISFYSSEKGDTGKKEGIGLIYIRYRENRYQLLACNIIGKLDEEKVRARLEIIEKLDRFGLRDLKRKQRHLQRGERGTANVGLIQVALTSENPLIFDYHPINDKLSFFSLMATVNSMNIS